MTVVGKGENSSSYQIPEDYTVAVSEGEMVKSKQIIASAKDENQYPIRSKAAGMIKIENSTVTVVSKGKTAKEYVISEMAGVYVSDGDEIKKGQVLTDGHLDLQQSYELAGCNFTQRYIMTEVQKIYASQGQEINDKHLEVIVRQMNSKCRVIDPGDSEFLEGGIQDWLQVAKINSQLKKAGKKEITSQNVVMGITRVALKTESFLSAASFMETTSILINAAINGDIDYLRGLKENVIIGRKIPAGTGFRK